MLLICSSLLPALAPAKGAPPADGKELKVLAHGDWPYLPVHSPAPPARKQELWAFRGEKELAKVAGPHAALMVARAMKVKAIDWKKQMLLAVSDGTQPLVGISGGRPPSAPNRVEISRAEVDEGGKVMTVRWRLVPRKAKAAVITSPLEADLVERFDGEIRFVREPTQAKDKGEEARGKEVKVLSRAFWPDGWEAEEPARQWVVRRHQDLIDPRLEAPEEVLERTRKEAAARYAEALKVDAIDVTKDMVIGVSAGVRPTGGYHVEVTKVEADPEGQRLTVCRRLRVPRQGEKAQEELTHPAVVALVEQFAGEVRFEEERADRP
jgi:hypothetical protein